MRSEPHQQKNRNPGKILCSTSTLPLLLLLAVSQWTQDDTSEFARAHPQISLTTSPATTRSARSAGQTVSFTPLSPRISIKPPSIHSNSPTLPRCLPRPSHRPYLLCYPLISQKSLSNPPNPHRKDRAEILARPRRRQSSEIRRLCHSLPLPLHDPYVYGECFSSYSEVSQGDFFLTHSSEDINS
jgi:hypothetical protein